MPARAKRTTSRNQDSSHESSLGFCISTTMTEIYPAIRQSRSQILQCVYAIVDDEVVSPLPSSRGLRRTVLPFFCHHQPNLRLRLLNPFHDKHQSPPLPPLPPLQPAVAHASPVLSVKQHCYLKAICPEVLNLLCEERIGIRAYHQPESRILPAAEATSFVVFIGNF